MLLFFFGSVVFFEVVDVEDFDFFSSAVSFFPPSLQPAEVLSDRDGCVDDVMMAPRA